MHELDSNMRLGGSSTAPMDLTSRCVARSQALTSKLHACPHCHTFSVALLQRC